VTFEEVPELYDRARPGYPAELFDDLVRLAAIPAGGRVLEIGCGTGQASVPLAERGLELVCVELGAGLAAIARRKLAAFPRVEVVNAPFETWEPHDRSFDAVVAFTAFHWLDPEVRFRKAAAILRAEGALAVVETQHVRPEGADPFWVEVQDDYDAVVPSDENRPPPRPDEVGDLRSEIEASGCFRKAAARRYLWDVTYSAAEYVAVLDTYSGHRELEPGRRHELYDRIRRRIESRPSGRVTKTYLATLNVASASPPG
jgi:SAM-dependent methyltransferase